jgi:hypothetical protein
VGLLWLDGKHGSVGLYSASGRIFDATTTTKGQSCSAGTRVLVQESVREKFEKLFVAAVEAYKVGDPFDDDTFQGPQVSKGQVTSPFLDLPPVWYWNVFLTISVSSTKC